MYFDSFCSIDGRVQQVGQFPVTGLSENLKCFSWTSRWYHFTAFKRIPSNRRHRLIPHCRWLWYVQSRLSYWFTSDSLLRVPLWPVGKLTVVGIKHHTINSLSPQFFSWIRYENNEIFKNSGFNFSLQPVYFEYLYSAPDFWQFPPEFQIKNAWLVASFSIVVRVFGAVMFVTKVWAFG